MSNNESFEEGIKYFQQNVGGQGAFQGADYYSKVKDAINKTQEDLLNRVKTQSGSINQSDINKLKGFMAEVWHADTYNIDAIVKGDKTRAMVPKSNAFASPDIAVNNGVNAGLKYDVNPAHSLADQSKSYWERYNQDMTNHRKNNLPEMSFEEYLKERNINSSEIDKYSSIYNNQTRIIPKEQLESAIKVLKEKIEKEELNRPELLSGYKETLEHLQDRLKTSDGTESIPLSNREAEELARLAKDGNLDVSNFGLTTEQLIKVRYIIQQSLKSGLTAATISMVLKVAPEIYKTVDKLIKDGEIDREEFKKVGFAALKGTAQGFITGTVSSALTTACLSGALGETLRGVNPTVIGSITVIVVNTISSTYELTVGKITKGEFANELTKDLFVTSFSLFSAGVIQTLTPELPVLGYLLGSFVGSIGASFIYDTGYKYFLSLCCDTGFSCFSLVEQNYMLPEKILKDMGVITFDFKKIEYKNFDFKTITYEKFEFKKFDYKTISIKVLNRSVIGINKIGYDYV